jgi:hypothetical protein
MARRGEVGAITADRSTTREKCGRRFVVPRELRQKLLGL